MSFWDLALIAAVAAAVGAAIGAGAVLGWAWLFVSDEEDDQ